MHKGIFGNKAGRVAILACAAGTMALAASSARAAIEITEVDPSGSSSTSNTYNADWFELTNTGSTAVDITGWKMDDNSHTYADAVALNNVTSIAPGQSVVFIEDTSATSDTALNAAFESFWFGSNVPAGFTVGDYGGSGVGLSQTADEVNIYDASGDEVVGMGFGASSTGVTFDNSAGIGSPSQPDPIISTVSQVGVNGAFASANAAPGEPNEIGSPGFAPGDSVPEPTSGLIFAVGAGMLLKRRAGRRA